MIKTLYKKSQGDMLVVTGHLSRKEINELMKDGYRFKKPIYNKNGIKIEG